MVFMQDNAPCHKALIVTQFFDENNIKTLDWSAQSPDINPIENLWAFIKKRRKKIWYAYDPRRTC
jgi:transposase